MIRALGALVFIALLLGGLALAGIITPSTEYVGPALTVVGHGAHAVVDKVFP